ncbi:MAG: hypothetical protein LUI87_09065 [Lachnospiraceae bacterium]|nr:hypothetical protein [Lachnospiraceae bacterium]
MQDWKSEETQEFLNLVRERLSNMTQWQKDCWIMSQARLETADGYESFLKSLSGNPDSRCLPEDKEIEAFCEKVAEGEIYLEYNTWYEEFDSFGSYKDDWEVEYRDPFGIMNYLDEILSGCHDLIKLGSYWHAARTLEKICRLEFAIEEYEDSEDFDPDANPFSLADVYRHHLLHTDQEQAAEDLIYAYYMSHKDQKNEGLAEKIADLLLLPLCRELLPGDVLKNEADPAFFQSLSMILEEKEQEIAKLLKKEDPRYSLDAYDLKDRQEHVQKMLAQLQLLSKQEGSAEEEGKRLLSGAWAQIGELLASLRYEPYIDDQWEISEIWDICEKLIKEHKCQAAPWSLRKKILSDIAENEYYDYYGCYDPMKDLVKELCLEPQENLEFADLLCQANRGVCTKEAAELYHKYGAEKKYMKYLQEHLGKTNQEYINLMDCYEKQEAWDKVIETGELALDKCKEDMTDIFIRLIRAARKQGDVDGAESYFVKARRRRKIEISKVEEAYVLLRSL